MSSSLLQARGPRVQSVPRGANPRSIPFALQTELTQHEFSSTVLSSASIHRATTPPQLVPFAATESQRHQEESLTVYPGAANKTICRRAIGLARAYPRATASWGQSWAAASRWVKGLEKRDSGSTPSCTTRRRKPGSLYVTQHVST